jgi:hypothetical protein
MTSVENTTPAPIVETEPPKKKRRVTKKKVAADPPTEEPAACATECPAPCNEPAACATECSTPCDESVVNAESESKTATRALLIKNKVTELVKQSGCSMSHAEDKGTLATLQKMVEAALIKACTEAKKRNKKADRPQVTERDFASVIAAIKVATEFDI